VFGSTRSSREGKPSAAGSFTDLGTVYEIPVYEMPVYEMQWP